MFVGDGKRYGNLAIRSFAKLTTILMPYSDGMFPLFGNPRIVDDPCRYRSILGDCGNRVIPNLGENRFVVPRAFGDEMMNRLMPSVSM
jgi:hypothetical protein